MCTIVIETTLLCRKSFIITTTTTLCFIRGDIRLCSYCVFSTPLGFVSLGMKIRSFSLGWEVGDTSYTTILAVYYILLMKVSGHTTCGYTNLTGYS